MKKNLFAGNSTLSEPPVPHNEPVCMYEVDSPERESLKQTLEQVASEEIEIFPIVNGERISTGNTETVSMPHDHGHSLAKFHKAGKKEAEALLSTGEAKRNAELNLVDHLCFPSNLLTSSSTDSCSFFPRVLPTTSSDFSSPSSFPK